MLPLLAKTRFPWTPEQAARPLKELRHRPRRKVARIQGSVSVRQQHALKNLQQLSPKRPAQVASKLVPLRRFWRGRRIPLAATHARDLHALELAGLAEWLIARKLLRLLAA